MKINMHARSLTGYYSLSIMTVLKFYTGSMPEADSTPTGTLLTFIGTGNFSSGIPWNSTLSLFDNVNGTTQHDLVKSEMATASGTIGYAMLTDDITSPTKWAYLTVGTSGAEINLPRLTLSEGSTITLAAGFITTPAGV